MEGAVRNHAIRRRLAGAALAVTLAAVASGQIACGGKQSAVTRGHGSEAEAEASAVDPRAAMTVPELRAAFATAEARRQVGELAAVVSALEARGAIEPAASASLIDGLAADELEAFVAGARAGSQTATLAGRRAAAMAEHVKPASTAAGERLAVILPLSGPHAAVGVEFRAAISVATKDAGVEVVVIDTRGTEEGARAAVTEAVSQHQVTAILGPVGERESRAAAARAVALGVPIGVFAPEETGAAPSIGVFRLWPSREADAAEAATIAVELGYDAPAVLAPRDELGEAAAKAFVEAARRAGASQVRAGTYDPSATELEPDLKAFLGLVPMTNERLRRHLRRHGRKKGWKSFSPDVDFDLLYIPDTYARAALVASYLPFFNVELRAGDIVDTMGLRRKHGGRLPSVVQLLGSAEWHHPSLVTRGGAAVDGALIVESCVGGANEDYLDDAAAQLAARLRRAIGRPPSRVASRAYDAARMILDRYKQGVRGKNLFVGARSRSGACGPALIGVDGQLRRESLLLRVEGQDLVLHEW